MVFKYFYQVKKDYNYKSDKKVLSISLNFWMYLCIEHLIYTTFQDRLLIVKLIEIDRCSMSEMNELVK